MQLVNLLKNIKDPIPLNFIGDPTDLHFKSFEVIKNGKRIKKKGEYVLSDFTHS
jgi:hypothetical protein